MVTLALVFNLFFGNPSNVKFAKDTIMPPISATVIVNDLIIP